jgi:hypothetical protein
MGLYKQKFNPVSGSFNLVPTGTIITFKDGVANAAVLPSSGNTINDARITADTGHLYVWSGTVWVDQGDIVDLKWSAIDGKPNSSVVDIDDAVSKKHSNSLDHTQGTDQGLDTGGANAVTAAQAKAGYTHSQVAHAPSDAVSLATVKADIDIDNAIDNTHAPHSDDQVIPTALSQLSDDTTHRLVTDTEKGVWNGKQNALGFTPEDVSNKDTTITLGTSDTKYPSQKAVKSYVDALGIGVNTLRDFTLNIMLNSFRIAQQGALTLLNMVDGFMDEYEDESGIDTVNSINQYYNSVDDYYTTEDVDTKLLLHLDNNVIDVKGNIVTNNNVTFSDSIYKFGTHSAYFDGSTASLSIADSDDWDFGTGDFTIDFWVRVPNDQITAACCISIGHWTTGVTIHFGTLDSGYWNIYIKGSGYVPSRPILLVNTWYHVAIVRTGTTLKVFTNGVKSTSDDTDNSDITGLTGVTIGAYPAGQEKINGYLDEVRISKGIARWTSDFTPPINAYGFGNMTLLSNAQVAELVPTEARIVLFEEDVDEIAINTDLKAYISRNDGNTYSEVVLEDAGNYISGAQILTGTVDISSQPPASDIKLLLHLDNSIVDATGKTVTNNGVTFSDTVKKFGTHSSIFNGTTSYLSIPDSADWDFGTGDFTIDGWFRFTSVFNSYLVAQYQDGANYRAFYYDYGSSRLAFFDTTALITIVSSNGSFLPIADTWYHLAVVRNAGVISLYVNGIALTLSTNNNPGGSIGANSGALLIGNLDPLSPGMGLNGYIDEVRISKGVAYWTSNFTPSLSAYGDKDIKYKIETLNNKNLKLHGTAVSWK